MLLQPRPGQPRQPLPRLSSLLMGSVWVIFKSITDRGVCNYYLLKNTEPFPTGSSIDLLARPIAGSSCHILSVVVKLLVYCGIIDSQPDNTMYIIQCKICLLCVTQRRKKLATLVGKVGLLKNQVGQTFFARV